jgi:signal transduction histidine kinase
MKRVALVFVLAVFVPSLVLAWLAVRTLRDQQFLLERQQSLLYQGVADTKAKAVQDVLAQFQRDFAVRVASVVGKRSPRDAAGSFDDLLRRDWPLVQVGYAVTLSGDILSPSPYGRADARKFYTDNGRFLASREVVEVYSNPKQTISGPNVANNAAVLDNSAFLNTQPQAQSPSWAQNEANVDLNKRSTLNKGQQARNVYPQQQAGSFQKFTVQEDNPQQFSKLAASEAEFRQLIGEDTEGALARFVDNRLNVLFWYRLPQDPQVVFGAQLALPRLIESLRPVVHEVEPALRGDICVALLDDTAKPVALSHPGFRGTWKHPFVATEIGEILPHWEVAVYLLNPARLTQSARTLQLTLGLLIGVLLVAIGIGSWLIVTDLNRQLTLARQKTDFVSNVSHELKTPLTSIRMFSELLAEGRVTDPGKQRSYLGIITAETARLTRLINNVLDFARLERGEKKYHMQRCDLAEVVRETADTYRPHLEANGFHFECDLPESALPVNGDRDALAQVVVNLLSNAEKYSNSNKDIAVRVEQRAGPLPCAEVTVLDRGLGVPAGCGEKIFEQFYRAHDSLSSGIQGSGLGLTLARQIARAHGGDVVYEPRDGGGSCFCLRLPLLPQEQVRHPDSIIKDT